MKSSDETTLVAGTIPTLPPLMPVLATPVLVPEWNPEVALPNSVRLTSSLNVESSEDNPSQALFTITYGNAGGVDAKDVVIRHTLDDMVSYVTNSATGNAKFNAAKRELSWSLPTLPANTLGQTVSFRVAARSPDADRFLSVATIEDSSNTATASNLLEYSFGATPLSTVFAMPDRIIEGRSKAPFMDVKGTEYQAAINRLNAMGVLAKELVKNGAAIVGKVDPASYEFDDSEAIFDGMFIGLPIDEDFQPELTDERVSRWANAIKPAFGL